MSIPGVTWGTCKNTPKNSTTSGAVPRLNCRSKPPRMLSIPLLVVWTAHLFILRLKIACIHVLVSNCVGKRVLRTRVALCVGKTYREQDRPRHESDYFPWNIRVERRLVLHQKGTRATSGHSNYPIKRMSFFHRNHPIRHPIYHHTISSSPSTKNIQDPHV